MRLTKNFRKVEHEDGTIYEYLEGVFDLPWDRRDETEKSIKKNADQWWIYAAEDHTPPTLEERVTILEDILMEM